MNRALVLLIALCGPGRVAATDLAAELAVKNDEKSHTADVLRDGKPLVRYMYAFDASTPEKRFATGKSFHHVFAPDGKTLITNGAGGVYPHHRGIFIGWNKLTWGNQRYDLWHVRDTSMVHQKFLETKTNDDGSVTLVALIHWLSGAAADSRPLLEETRKVTIYPAADAHLLLDFETDLKAINGDVYLDGDPEHAGFHYRPSNEVAQNKSARYTFHKDGINPRNDEDLPWVALNYTTGGQKYTVQLMSHPDNPVTNAVFSAYRNYGRFGEFLKHLIRNGKSLKLKYRFRITLGNIPARAELQKQYDAYVR